MKVVKSDTLETCYVKYSIALKRTDVQVVVCIIRGLSKAVSEPKPKLMYLRTCCETHLNESVAALRGLK